MIRVLIAEDSVTARELLVAMLDSDPDITVIGQARNGQEAVDMARRLRPDVMTMDINMPVCDGFEATKRIMSQNPLPIVIVSATIESGQVENAMRALRMGAVMVLPKPPGPASPAFARHREELVSAVKSMSQVKVVRLRGARPQAAGPRRDPAAAGRSRGIVALAASTGGPVALERILSALPADFPLPIVVVQHIADGFLAGMAAWLGTTSALDIRVAAEGETLLPGTVYLAPDGRHLTVGKDFKARLLAAAPEQGYRPSATVLLRSVAQACGADAIAVVLTGMGADGCEGARDVRAAGGRVVVQDAATSVVFGMPKAVVDAGLAHAVLPLEALPNRILDLALGRRLSGGVAPGRRDDERPAPTNAPIPSLFAEIKKVS